jgi:hypothetical protein
VSDTDKTAPLRVHEANGNIRPWQSATHSANPEWWAKTRRRENRRSRTELRLAIAAGREPSTARHHRYTAREED